ncbi:protein PIN-LIKES 2-like [Silene latifolia]|uniref:protein PIN-LIKES 2-like n=1 Tax=Silene latifolia TaxID=37657 RepID=UPI003D774373
MAESLFFKLYDEKIKEQSVLSGITPLMKLISLTLIGVILANPKLKLIPKDTFKLLSKLVFALFLPCMIFTHLGQSITLENFTRWWFIPLNVIISTAIGTVLGYIVAIICRPPPQYFRFTVIMTALGNTGNLHLAIITSVCHSKNHPFGPDCQTRGVAYASFAQWVAVTLVYTFVYHMMEPPLDYYEVVDSSDDEIVEEQDDDYLASTPNDSTLSMPLLNEAEWPGMQDKETELSKTPFIGRVFSSLVSLSESLHSVPGYSSLEEGDRNIIICFPEPKMVRKIRIVAKQTPIKHILQPPTIASLLALTIGMVPYFKGLVFGDVAPLLFLTDGLNIMAGAMVPSVMLVLGGMLAEGPDDQSRLGLRTTIGIVVARLLVLPLIGIGVLLLADKFGLLVEGDEMFKFVIMLHYVTPSAILLGAIASLRGYAVKEASSLLFWQHVFAVLSISLYMIVFFKVLI